MKSVEQFIQDHQLGYDTITIEKEIEHYLKEMQAGLDGKKSSLLMIPTYLAFCEKVVRNKKIVCVDAGGTNLRITTAYFDDAGTFRAETVARHVMPGVDKTLTAQEFFDEFAEKIAPYAYEVRNIALSFAFRTNMLENIDCEIIEITKEVKVTGAEGKQLGKEVAASLAKKGIEGCRIIILNDSVATALAGQAEYLNEGFGTYTGTILGTGSNSCYIEKNENIKKLNGLPKKGMMVINTEAGSYDKLPRSDIDRAYDASMQNPGIGVSEKMASGRYLGELCLLSLRFAAKEGVFESQEIAKLARLGTEEVSRFLETGEGVLKEYFLSEKDKKNAQRLLENNVRRAARVVALQMAAVVKKACKGNNKICMTIEGTTYEKMFGLKEELLKGLLPYLEKEGYDAKMVMVDMAVLKGCAIAGLNNM